ncbi:hypothetical protein B0H15DRAFT_938487 [Mycena belliarum]|uniref:Uncharacterized protein n=1 Tax=Mycena belliarum TaxID=1033014 RepID=A0AAD6U7L4_9AGAR|nr:hypothetical protein B0H15DRAFT_938487 [Mycena belliae]
MARGKRKQASHAEPKGPLKKPKCPWCKQHRDGRGFDKHQVFCRADHLWRKNARAALEPHFSNGEDADGPEIDLQPFDAAQPMDLDPPGPSPGPDTAEEFIGPLLPGAYFKYIPHPHSTDPTPMIVPLTSSSQRPSFTEFHPETRAKAWFPFRTRADFEVAEIVVKGGLNPDLTNNLLTGVNENWGTGKSCLTIRNSNELQDILATARKYGVTFKAASVFASYKGQIHEIKFEYRDPWEWITTLLNDSTLSSTSMYHAVQKFYCEGTTSQTYRERVVDEPNTADAWWISESKLPEADPYPHCLFPMHIWLDEGLVTKRVTMHPMVLRPVFQPGNIRNASGNGGGILVGYMTAIHDPLDPTSRNAPQTLEFAKYKMEIYQKILAVIFSSCKCRSHGGEPIRCPDNVARVFHPDILISSLDGKEAAYFNACRAALANFPCPKCLVHKADLHKITGSFELRTSATMKATVVKAMKKATKTKTEDILKSFGLHGVKHFLWDFRFSDPYAAYSYDTLHSDDLGKWGHHLWPLLLDALENLQQKGTFAENMRRFSRWPNLKHFNQVTTVHFTDGQSFYDILKCVLPCIVQLFPPEDPLVHCIRAYQQYRIMVGMHCMPERRLERLDVFIQNYEHWCSMVSDVYGKSFDFFKQHATSHVVADIRAKGTTNHGSTRPGEGFQQEAHEAYLKTNGKDVARQMNRIDETQEAIARIRMTIDNDDKATHESEDTDHNIDETPVDPEADAHWAFGAPVPGRLINSLAFEDANNGSAFRNFDFRLRRFISDTFPEERIKYEDTIMIRSFKCVHLSYQSLEDWRGARDIIRCNNSFHGRTRFDCFLVNLTDPGLHFARVRSLLRCSLPSGRQIDVALVHMFVPSRWKPRTRWAGYQIRDEERESSFLSMEHVIRGALLEPVASSAKEAAHFVIDTIDADMFLRADM